MDCGRDACEKALASLVTLEASVMNAVVLNIGMFQEHSFFDRVVASNPTQQQVEEMEQLLMVEDEAQTYSQLAHDMEITWGITQ